MNTRSRPKFFPYLSSTKIETLFAQLPRQGVSMTDDEASLPDKLSAVCAHLEKQPGLVGTVDAPLTYFQGALQMHTSSLSPFGVTHLIALCGETERTSLALVGAASCLNAEMTAWNNLGLGVPLYQYLAICGGHLGDDPWSDGSGKPAYMDKICRGRTVWLYFRVVASAYRRAALLYGEQGTTPNAGVATQKVEFTARTIERCEVDGHAFLVGSPLYVAVVDD
jgi:hypothetical protein